MVSYFGTFVDKVAFRFVKNESTKTADLVIYRISDYCCGFLLSYFHLFHTKLLIVFKTNSLYTSFVFHIQSNKFNLAEL